MSDYTGDAQTTRYYICPVCFKCHAGTGCPQNSNLNYCSPAPFKYEPSADEDHCACDTPTCCDYHARRWCEMEERIARKDRIIASLKAAVIRMCIHRHAARIHDELIKDRAQLQDELAKAQQRIAELERDDSEQYTAALRMEAAIRKHAREWRIMWAVLYEETARQEER